MSVNHSALIKLLQQLAIPAEQWLPHTHITGSDPVVPSRYQTGLASATALAAHAIGIAEIWRQRSGQMQDINIDIARAAVPGLRSVSHVKRDGHSLQLKRPASENKSFFESHDGRQLYLLRHAFYPQTFSRLLACLDCSSTTESLTKAVARRDALELEDALAECRAMGAIARTQEEWLAHPQGKYLASRTPIEVNKIGESDAEPLPPANRPLEGLKVVDMGHVLAGPIVSRCLAEQGAEVIHVSAPHMPDPNHIIVDTAFGKRTAFVDLRIAEDREKLKRLISEADIFVHSWRGGSLEQYGLSSEELATLRPGLIYVALSCYGSGGPWETRAGYDPFGQVVSGLAVGEGSLDEPVLASTFTLNDYLAGYLAAAGVTSAILRRAQHGGSYRVNVSLTGSSMWLQDMGKLPAAQWPEGAEGITILPDANPLDLTTTKTFYGEIEHAKPIIHYSDTKAYWALPPMPAGSTALQWD